MSFQSISTFPKTNLPKSWWCGKLCVAAARRLEHSSHLQLSTLTFTWKSVCKQDFFPSFDHTVHQLIWTDLASCHYSKAPMQWYNPNNGDVIPKSINPPNCPQLRLIEKCWAIVKAKLMRSSGAAKKVKSMLDKWDKAASKVMTHGVQTWMGSIRKKVLNFIRNAE